MCCKSWKTILPFALTFLVGIFAVSFWLTENKSKPTNIKSVTLSGNSLQIISKPKALYTQEARENQTQGSVTLRVVFLQTGEIGNVQVVNGLPDGLTEQAVLAAKGIKFTPFVRNEEAINVTKLVQYNFTLY